MGDAAAVPVGRRTIAPVRVSDEKRVQNGWSTGVKVGRGARWVLRVLTAEDEDRRWQYNESSAR